ncbi:MAG: hypothetical protein C0408_00025 [Odoribacter sp.]|nr:hypothetical protein [Odoribacter sp.]
MERKNFETVCIRYMRKILALVIFVFLFSILSGQKTRQEVPPLKERLFYGGSFSLMLGSVTNIEISPVIGLWILPRVAVAAGTSYTFYKSDNVKTDIFGGRAFVQYVLFRDLDKFIPLGIHTSFFLHTEDEMLSLDSYFWKINPGTQQRFIINTVLSGVGLSQQIGTRASVNFMVLWPLNDSGYSIYSSPEFRIGFIF